jgi:hypothetical protein
MCGDGDTQSGRKGDYGGGWVTNVSKDLSSRSVCLLMTDNATSRVEAKKCTCWLSRVVRFEMDPRDIVNGLVDSCTTTTARRREAADSMRRIMSDHTVSLPVPDYIYDRARQIAAGTAQSIEAVLLQQLEDAFAEPLPALPPDEQRELEALAHLSDEALWTMAREHMAPEKQARLHALMEANSQGTLDEPQRAALEALVAQGQRLSVRKAQAAALLTERGYRITIAALSIADE